MSEPFVILLHRHHGPTHFDLMIRRGDALATWQLATHPSEAGTAGPLTARRLPDHRLAYLTCEGPVSRGRGEVRRVAEGTAEVHRADDAEWTFRLDSEAIAGEFALTRDPADPGRWVFREA